MFNSIRFYCSLPGWVISTVRQLSSRIKRVDNVAYVPYDAVEDLIEDTFTKDQEQHETYYREFMLHLNSLYHRDRAEYAGIVTGLFLGNAYRGVDDALIEMIRHDQVEHLKELEI